MSRYKSGITGQNSFFGNSLFFEYYSAYIKFYGQTHD